MKQSKISQVGHYAGIIFIMFWGLAPFYWMVVTALRDSNYTFDTTPWPTHVTLDNFKDALATDKGNDFLGAIGNSLLISLCTTALAVAIGVFTALFSRAWSFPAKVLSPASSWLRRCSPASRWSLHYSNSLVT